MKVQKNNTSPQKDHFLLAHKGSIFIALTALLINMSVWFFMFFKKPANNFALPLHYDVYQGVDVIDVWSKLYYLPILGLMLIVVNYILSALISPKDVMITYFLNIASVVIQIILFVALYWIIYLQNDLFQL